MTCVRRHDLRGTSEVDGRPVLDGVLVAPARLGELLLEELVSGKLGSSLQEVSDGGRAEPGREAAEALPAQQSVRNISSE